MHQLALGTPAGIVHPVEILDIVGIGEGRIAHPQPDPVIALDHRIGPHAASRRHVRLARHADAIAVRIVFKPVIWALDHIADQLAFRQRCMAMGAFIFERNRRAVFLAVEHHRLIQQRAPQKVLAADLGVPGANVPGIFKKHRKHSH